MRAALLRASSHWQKQHGRRDLPWQNTRDPYRIWLSEIMLQQTQVSAVIPYYLRFLARFPDLGVAGRGVRGRGAAPVGRARLLRARTQPAPRRAHRHARTWRHLPAASTPPSARCRESAAAPPLPSVHSPTAARHAILDGNVKRVLARHFGVAGYPGEKRVETLLWAQLGGLAARAGNRGLHPGPDGPGRRRLRAVGAALRPVPGGRDLRSSARESDGRIACAPPRPICDRALYDHADPVAAG